MLPEKINIPTSFKEFQRQIEDNPDKIFIKNFIFFIINDDITFKQVICSYDNLVKLLQLCIAYKKEILEFILERDQVFNSFFFFTNIARSIDDFNCYKFLSKYVDLILYEQSITSKVPNFRWLLNFARLLHNKDKERLMDFFKKHPNSRKELFYKE